MKEYDFIIVGSGFGGSVSAMRLAQKGYSVLILEKGKEWKNDQFPKTNWLIHKFLWAPLLRCFGPQAITLLDKVMILHGNGVGGGSLVYANTLMDPPDKVFHTADWPQGKNWSEELAPHYRTAKQMLGATTNKYIEPGERALEAVANKMGVGDTYHRTEVGIFFGAPGECVADPYFAGHGPDRVGCDACGACMIGCPNGAKNTLDKNYLYFARQWGAEVVAETKVKKIEPLAGGGYEVETGKSTAWFFGGKKRYKAKNVILSAGVLGTVDLLFRCREEYSTLPSISSQLGRIVRTNNESLTGAIGLDGNKEMSRGIAIGASFFPDEHTRIENVRYPKGSDAMRFLAVPLTGDGNRLTRPLKMFASFFLAPFRTFKTLFISDWASRSQILLFMQSLESKIKLISGRRWWAPWSRTLKGKIEKGYEVPSFFPDAQKAATLMADELNGAPMNVASEVFLGIPATAHILGGAVMGDGPENGVIDERHEVFGHSGLFVCDASVIPCNLAVNPSLTITAMAERFASHFPMKEGAPSRPQIPSGP